jgi:hypothetical protein
MLEAVREEPPKRLNPQATVANATDVTTCNTFMIGEVRQLSFAWGSWFRYVVLT